MLILKFFRQFTPVGSFCLVACCFLLLGCSRDQQQTVDFTYRSCQDPSFSYSAENWKEIPFEQNQNLDLGFYRGDVWVKCTLTNQLPRSQSYVIYTADQINRSYHFYQISDGTCTHVPSASGSDDDRSYQYIKPNFVCELDSLETAEYLIHMNGDGRVSLVTPEIASLEDFVQYVRQDSLRNYLLYGAALVVLLINICYWILLQHKIYVFYVSYLITVLLFLLGLDGTLYDKGIDSHIIDHAIFIFLRCWMTSLFLFTALLFEVKQRHPRFYRLCSWYFLIAVGGFTLYQFVFFESSISNLHAVEFVVSLCSFLLIMSMVVLSYKDKKREAKPYLIVFTVYLVLYLLSLVRSVEHAIPGMISSFFKAATALEYLVFTFTIVISIKRKLRENEELAASITRLKEESSLKK